jgi:WD40 repeat protein
MLWDLPGSMPLGTLQHGSNTTRIEQITFSKDGTLLASSGNDGNARLWDVASRKLIGTIPVGRPSISASPIALSPDRRTLASGGMEGVVKLWPLGAGSSEKSR